MPTADIAGPSDQLRKRGASLPRRDESFGARPELPCIERGSQTVRTCNWRRGPRIGSSSEVTSSQAKTCATESRQVICCLRPLFGLPKRGKNAKVRAGSEFIRRISAVFIFSIRIVVFAVAVFASSLSSAATLSVQSELLCSPEGLMRLIPQFNVNGQFTIPNPNTDLQTFLSAQQGLSNAIDMILTQENISQKMSEAFHLGR